MVPVNFIRTDKITVYIPCLELGVVFLLFFFFFPTFSYSVLSLRWVIQLLLCNYGTVRV